MYKKKKLSKMWYFGIIIILFVLLSISLLLERDSNMENNIFKNISMTIEKIIMIPFTSLNKEKNITQTESYLIQKNVNVALEKEVQELKDVLELNKTLTEYDPINCTILSRNKSYWFNTITIDKGTKSGIKENMAVVTRNGLIGKVSKVSKNSSEIKLITADDLNFKVSVAVNTNNVDHYAIMNGYNSKTGYIKATGIDKRININKGDIVKTSGLGEMFPSGIYIGEVAEVKTDKYNISKDIFIKTKQDFNDIHYVTVLKVKK